MSQDDTPIEERRYVVLTDSRFYKDNTKFARKKPDCSRESGFWTSAAPEEVWIMDRDTALDVVSRLHHNNPRVVRAEKAIAQIEAQRDAKIRRQEADENLAILSCGNWAHMDSTIEPGDLGALAEDPDDPHVGTPGGP